MAIVLDIPEKVCAGTERSKARPFLRSARAAPAAAASCAAPWARCGGRASTGFTCWSGEAEVESATIERVPLWNDKRSWHGPFDIIGDVHGCYPELVKLLGRLGYQVAADGSTARHPDGRSAMFVGDLVDRGPDTPAVLRLVMGMTADGSGLSGRRNHEAKLVRALRGRDVTTSHGLAESLAQLRRRPGWLRHAGGSVHGPAARARRAR